MEQPAEGTQKVGHNLLERLATILLALATVATAWCAYQSTVWSGVQEYQLHDADLVNMNVSSYRQTAMQQTTIDIMGFVNYLNAVATHQDSLARFYQKRFPPHLRPAFDAWVALKPGINPDAPLTPFQMKEYLVPETKLANQLAVEYQAKFNQASDSNTHSEHYVLLTVIFASVMFFGGITSNISGLTTKRAVVIGSAVLLIISIGWMMTFPILVR